MGISISFRHFFLILIIASALLHILSTVLALLAHRNFFTNRVVSQRMAQLATGLGVFPNRVFSVLNIRNLIFMLIFIILAEYVGADIGGMKDFFFGIIGAVNDIFGFVIGFFS